MNVDKIINKRGAPNKLDKKETWLQHRINSKVKAEFMKKIGGNLSKWMDYKINEVIIGKINMENHYIHTLDKLEEYCKKYIVSCKKDIDRLEILKTNQSENVNDASIHIKNGEMVAIKKLRIEIKQIKKLCKSIEKNQ